MEDRNGRKAMFYNYKGVEIKQDECCILKATIAEHRRSKFEMGNHWPILIVLLLLETWALKKIQNVFLVKLQLNEGQVEKHGKKLLQKMKK